MLCCLVYLLYCTVLYYTDITNYININICTIRCLAWAEDIVLEEVIPDECDLESRQCYGPIVKGWRSNHLGTGSALVWCTAQVFSVLSGYHRLLRTLITKRILNQFGGQVGEV